MSTQTLALTSELYDYYKLVAFREPPILAELRRETAKLGGDAMMQIAPEQGALMGMIAAIIGAANILEIGTFTGYSSLAMALASQAMFVCADVNVEFTRIAKSFWKIAGVAERMDLRLSGGKAVIEELVGQGRAASFDLAFIDADKPSYDAYYEGALQLLRKGGLIMIDNVLWDGAVADTKKQAPDTVALRDLNAKIAKDRRVEHCMIPIGDGLTLARKL